MINSKNFLKHYGTTLCWPKANKNTSPSNVAQRPPDFDQVILLLPLLAHVFLNYTSFIFIKKEKQARSDSSIEERV